MGMTAHARGAGSQPRDEGEECSVAFVGAGNMAAEHIRAFGAVPGVRLRGIASRSFDRADALAKTLGVERAYSSIADMYQDTGADLVVIAVSELSVAGVAAECFSFPWACLIEKPAGYDLADAEAVAAKARSLSRRAYVALNRRHYSATRAVLDDLAGGAEQRFVFVQDQEDTIAARRAGRPAAVVDNWMYANSIHLVDYLMVFGRGRVTAVERVLPWTPGEPGIVAAVIRFDSGDIGMYQAVWNRPGPWSAVVTTQLKRWELRPLERAAVQPYGERALTAVPPHDWDLQFKPGLRRQAQAAVSAAKGRAGHDLPTLDDALITMRLVRDIYEPIPT